MTPVDKAGEQVIRFMGEAVNFSRIGELTTEVVTIANAGYWRRYTTAVGTDEWRECEFDYFLIACNLTWNDVSRIVAWSKTGSEIAPLMDREAPAEKRRSFTEAAAQWHAPGMETLTQRAARLGWMRADREELRAPPVSARIRARLIHGVTKDEHASKAREQRLSRERKAALDKLVRALRDEIADDRERLYVIDRLKAQSRHGRPAVSESDAERWRVDAANGATAKELAVKWGVSESQARRRLQQIREVTSPPSAA